MVLRRTRQGEELRPGHALSQAATGRATAGVSPWGPLGLAGTWRMGRGFIDAWRFHACGVLGRGHEDAGDGILLHQIFLRDLMDVLHGHLLETLGPGLHVLHA